MSEYIPGEFLKKSVSENDAYAVRGAIVAIILSDPAFKKGEAEAAINYAISGGVAVYEEHDDSFSMEQDKTKWNKDTFADETSFLQRNFSKERMKNIKEMGLYVYARSTQVQHKTIPVTPQKTNSYTSTTVKKQDFAKGRRLMIAAAVGIVAATVIIIALKK